MKNHHITRSILKHDYAGLVVIDTSLNGPRKSGSYRHGFVFKMMNNTLLNFSERIDHLKNLFDFGPDFKLRDTYIFMQLKVKRTNEFITHSDYILYKELVYLQDNGLCFIERISFTEFKNKYPVYINLTNRTIKSDKKIISGTGILYAGNAEKNHAYIVINEDSAMHKIPPYEEGMFYIIEPYMKYFFQKRTDMIPYNGGKL